MLGISALRQTLNKKEIEKLLYEIKVAQKWGKAWQGIRQGKSKQDQ